MWQHVQNTSVCWCTRQACVCLSLCVCVCWSFSMSPMMNWLGTFIGNWKGRLITCSEYVEEQSICDKWDLIWDAAVHATVRKKLLCECSCVWEWRWTAKCTFTKGDAHALVVCAWEQICLHLHVCMDSVLPVWIFFLANSGRPSRAAYFFLYNLN